MRTVVILATVVAAVIALLLWQLFSSDPAPKPATAAPTQQAPGPAPTRAAAARPRALPSPATPTRQVLAEREPPAPDVPTDRPTPNFAEPPPESEPVDDDLSDVDPERVSRCERAIAHTFDLWAKESAQGDPQQFRKQLVAGRPQALAKCARGEVTLDEMSCVLAATTTAEIQQCGIGGDKSSADAPEEVLESHL